MPTLAPLPTPVQTRSTVPPTSWRRQGVLLGAGALLLVAVVVSIGAGAMRIPPAALLGILLTKLGMSTTLAFDLQQEAVLWAIRLPRACLGVLVGASLGLAGAAMQGLFRNPLADPGLLGVSSGASLAAVATIVLQLTLFKTAGEWLGLYLLPLASFVGACGAILVVYQLSKEGGRAVISTMLLAGVAINALAGALTGLLTYLATDAQLRNITFWGLGSLGGASWPVILGMLPFLAGPLLWLPRLGKQLNLLALGEAQAAHLGLPVASLKRQLILLSALAVGTSVAVTGAIGFLGLVVPHIIRLIAGSDHRGVLLGSALGGAAVLTLADTLARTVVAPTELPISILTALLGTPAFLIILLREKRRLF